MGQSCTSRWNLNVKHIDNLPKTHFFAMEKKKNKDVPSLFSSNYYLEPKLRNAEVETRAFGTTGWYNLPQRRAGTCVWEVPLTLTERRIQQTKTVPIRDLNNP